MKTLKKTLKIVGILVALILFACFYFYLKVTPVTNPVWGINFSAGQARYLGLNPSEVFQRMLIELKPKKLRLMAYWEDMESEQGKYNFDDMDDLLNQSAVAGVDVTLVVGHKQPRWPECHHPAWYNNLSTWDKRQALLKSMEVAVGHFKSFSAIERWQVENEPFFDYGPDCPTITSADLVEEVALVKKLDSRPVVATDSGEKGGWISAAKSSDIFGTTMYRTVFNSKWGHYETYPLPPSWYRIRTGIVKTFTSTKNVIDVELQAEPWFKSDFYSTTLEQQIPLMDLERFQGNLDYARATGLPEHYLWGVEWWYWMKDHGHPEYWQVIQKQLNP
jgi:hypothetical protein